MRYLMLVYGNEEVWGNPDVDFATLVAEVDAFNTRLRESGELVAAEGLVTRPHHVRPGTTDVLDGPYLETKEFLGSYTLLDVDSEERALEIVAGYPGVRYGGGVDVWPLMEHGSAE